MELQTAYLIICYTFLFRNQFQLYNISNENSTGSQTSIFTEGMTLFL